jgi:hypothetical protein
VRRSRLSNPASGEYGHVEAGWNVRELAAHVVHVDLERQRGPA